MRELTAEIGAVIGWAGALQSELHLRFNADLAHALKNRAFDLPKLREVGYRYELLDQITGEVLLGVE